VKIMDELDLLFKLELDMENIMNCLRVWHLRLLGVEDGMCRELFCDVCPARIICHLWVKTVAWNVISDWDRLFNAIGLGQKVDPSDVINWEEAFSDLGKDLSENHSAEAKVTPGQPGQEHASIMPSVCSRVCAGGQRPSSS